MIRLGLDLDGVIYDFIGALNDYMLEYHGITGLPVPEYWAHTKDYLDDVGHGDKYVTMWRDHVVELFSFDRPYPGAVEWVREVQNDVHLVVMTHRAKRAAPATLGFLARHGIAPNEVHHLSNHQNRKSAIMPQCDVYVDDKEENVIDFVQNTYARRIYVPRRTWNTDVVENDRVRVYDDFSAIEL